MLKNAPIVILDEATANVDPENEDRLQKAIEALTRDKTIIMIAHRLKTVRHADKIPVLDRGRIVQQGSHEQLIAEPGIYADFVGGKNRPSIGNCNGIFSVKTSKAPEKNPYKTPVFCKKVNANNGV